MRPLQNSIIRNTCSLTIAIMLLAGRSVMAQNNSSPYSIIGIGDIEDTYFNRSSGLAGTGIALRYERYLNQNNPASYSALERGYFDMEVSARGRIVNYKGETIDGTNNTSNDFQIKRAALGIRINKFWGSSIGIVPFSSAYYNFLGVKYVEGTNLSTPVAYEGTGGVNQFYWGNAFKITRFLSIGVNASSLFGSLTQKETLVDNSLQTSLITTRNIYLQNLYFQYGLQYFSRLGKQWQLGIGATYAAPTNLNAEYNVVVNNGTAQEISNQIVKNDYFRLPSTMGAGLALTKNEQYTFTADYRHEAWSSLQYKGLNYSLVNSNRYSAGLEYSKHATYWGRRVETVFFQAGLYYANSYLNIYDTPINDKGITLGIGSNSKRNTLGYLMSLQFGQRGTTKNGLIQENYTSVNFTLSYRDFFFTGGKKYY